MMTEIIWRDHTTPGTTEETMLLRNHPKLEGQWPPVWVGLYEMEYKVPVGEKPDKLLFVEESQFTQAIMLTAEHGNRKLIGRLAIDDPSFRARLLYLLEHNIGKSIQEIGSIDLPD